jgi:GH25 family lysozyme M1 (1,4-beta-N-acetylmuramidase)
MKMPDEMMMGQGLRGRLIPSVRGAWDYFRVPTLMMPQGLFWSDVDLADVSYYQRQIDFEAMKRSGIRGVFIRAGQNLWVDKRFEENWSASKSVLPRGSYWFFDSRAEPHKQADLYFSLVKKERGELPMVVDFEENYHGKWAGWKNLYNFIERLRAHGIPSRHIWIYTGYWYWMVNSPIKPEQLNYFRQFKLWLASYTTNPKRVRIPRPWKDEDVKLWQWGTPVEGIERGTKTKEIDMNKWMGSEDEYHSFLKELKNGYA